MTRETRTAPDYGAYVSEEVLNRIRAQGHDLIRLSNGVAACVEAGDMGQVHGLVRELRDEVREHVGLVRAVTESLQRDGVDWPRKP